MIRAEMPEYRSWIEMRRRCRDPKRPEWKNYGGRGISVCQRWASFSAFLEDVGRRPGPGYSLDRINNSGNYEPGNVRDMRQEAFEEFCDAAIYCAVELEGG